MEPRAAFGGVVQKGAWQNPSHLSESGFQVYCTGPWVANCRLGTSGPPVLTQEDVNSYDKSGIALCKFTRKEISFTNHYIMQNNYPTWIYDQQIYSYKCQLLSETSDYVR